MSVEKKRAMSDVVWLCRNCAELADRPPERVPVATLTGWQRAAEEELLYRVTGLPKETEDPA